MSDARNRQLEREAVAMGGDAEERHAAVAARHGDAPWSHLVGEWVQLTGVRYHYRGILRDVRVYGGSAWALMHPLYEIDSFYSDTHEHGEPSGGGPRYTTPERPGIVPLAPVVDMCAQPPSWPRE